MFFLFFFSFCVLLVSVVVNYLCTAFHIYFYALQNMLDGNNYYQELKTQALYVYVFVCISLVYLCFFCLFFYM